MKTNIKQIATIQTGLFAKTVNDGDIVYLQARHFDDKGILKQSLQPELKTDGFINKHLLKTGDVLFAAKGTKNFATIYQSDSNHCVASTSFFVIRLKEKNILPEYLVWFLNHPNTQMILKGQAIGSSMVSISKSVLQELEISIPDLDTQRKILQISELRSKEKKLNLEIDILREKQIQQQIMNAIK